MANSETVNPPGFICTDCGGLFIAKKRQMVFGKPYCPNCATRAGVDDVLNEFNALQTEFYSRPRLRPDKLLAGCSPYQVEICTDQWGAARFASDRLKVTIESYLIGNNIKIQQEALTSLRFFFTGQLSHDSVFGGKWHTFALNAGVCQILSRPQIASSGAREALVYAAIKSKIQLVHCLEKDLPVEIAKAAHAACDAIIIWHRESVSDASPTALFMK